MSQKEILNQEKINEIVQLHQEWYLNGKQINIGKRADFSNYHLRDFALRDVVLNEAIFKNTSIEAVNFTRVRFINCNFKNAKIYFANFIECNLFESNFENSRLHNIGFFFSKLKKLNFKNANLRTCQFKISNLEESNLENAILPVSLKIPKSGEFIAWSTGINDEIIKFKVPWFSRRESNIFDNYSYVEIAKVISIEKNGKNLESCKVRGLVKDENDMIYVGKFVKAFNYDKHSGILVVLNRVEAENFNGLMWDYQIVEKI